MTTGRWKTTRSRWMLLACLVTLATSADVYARAGAGGSEGALKIRYFTAEIPQQRDGGVIRVGVKLPLGAKVAKTEVFVDSEDKGSEKSWSKCDNKTKKCAIGDARIIRFHRENREAWQELAVDVNSESGQPRYAKISVVYQPQSGRDRTGCNRTNLRCGFTAEASD